MQAGAKRQEIGAMPDKCAIIPIGLTGGDDADGQIIIARHS